MCFEEILSVRPSNIFERSLSVSNRVWTRLSLVNHACSRVNLHLNASRRATRRLFHRRFFLSTFRVFPSSRRSAAFRYCHDTLLSSDCVAAFFFSLRNRTVRRVVENGRMERMIQFGETLFGVVRSRNVEFEARVSSRYWWKDCLKFDHCGKRDENVRSGRRVACASYEGRARPLGRGTLKISKQRYCSGNVICR